jgi:hypothetical protein
MKRLIALAALLLAASACATTTENANTTANTNTNAAPSATPTPSGVSQADIEAKERQAWDAVKSKNVDAFGALLADDFINVNDTGVYDKAGTVKGMQGEVATDVTLSNFKLLKIDEDAAAITYDVAWTGAHEGKSQTVNLRASSAWAKRGGAWLAVYHQATAVGEPPAGEAPKAGVSPIPPASNANTNAAANTNSAGSLPPEAPDPVSKEKKLWEELKAKDYDAFASDLADEAIEVEPQGRYDKAGSISGVKSMDASKYALSDWKETKIDADASVVTYLVKSTDGKEEERHATVWAKRGQRWYAILHQGTPAMKMKK